MTYEHADGRRDTTKYIQKKDGDGTMIPCWTAQAGNLVVAEHIAKGDPAIAEILAEIRKLDAAIGALNLRIEMISQRADIDITNLDARVTKLEKRHTLHRHWTEMGR